MWVGELIYFLTNSIFLSYTWKDNYHLLSGYSTSRNEEMTLSWSKYVQLLPRENRLLTKLKSHSNKYVTEFPELTESQKFVLDILSIEKNTPEFTQ